MSKLSDFTEATPVVNDFLTDTVDADEIIIGGTCTHVFELPFIYDRVVKSARVIYKQGLEVKLTVDVKQSMIQIKGTSTNIYVFLPVVYTELFDKTLLDAYCQLEIITKDNKKLYDEPHKLRVLAPLTDSEKPVGIIDDVKVNGESVVFGGVAYINVPENMSDLVNDVGYISKVKTINGQSIEGEGNIEIKEVFVKDFSDITLLEVSPVEFIELIRNHYHLIDAESLIVPTELFDCDEASITIRLNGTNYVIRLSRNNPTNMTGTLVMAVDQSIYELVIGLLYVEGELKAIIRCASIYQEGAIK